MFRFSSPFFLMYRTRYIFSIYLQSPSFCSSVHSPYKKTLICLTLKRLYSPTVDPTLSLIFVQPIESLQSLSFHSSSLMHSALLPPSMIALIQLAKSSQMWKPTHTLFYFLLFLLFIALDSLY